MPPSDSQELRASVADRYRALLDIGRTLAGTLSLEELYEAIHRETARVLEASGFYISLYDQGRDLATVVYYVDHGEVERVDVTYRGSDSEVIRERKAALIEDDLGARSLLMLGDDGTDLARASASAPMIHKGKVVGAISAQSYQAGVYVPEDLDLLQGIADIATVAIDNALHIAELEQRKREAERVEEIGRALTSSLDPTVVLGKVVHAVNDILQADGSSVWMCDPPESHIFKVVASAGDIALPNGVAWDLTGPIADRLIEKTEPLIMDDLATNPLVPPHLREHLEAGSGLAVPLILGGEVSGALSAGSREARFYGEDDVKVLQRLASQASVALENARLHAHLQSLSLTDPLTGLPNRRHLQIHLEKEVAAARRGRSLVVVVFDLDDFKDYNDTHGHLVGDDILRAFAQILDEENRAMNLVARYGGDEFVSILSESHMDGARLYVQRVTKRVAEDGIMGQYGVTVSMGLAEFDRASMKTREEVIQAADADMYRVKAHQRKGRRAASN